MTYETHFLLNIDTAKQYVLDKTDFFETQVPEDLKSVELSDGNINYVYRISDANKSVIVKQSDNKIRSSGRALDMGRSQIEYNILTIERELAGNVIPEVYSYDKTMSVIVMEDISAYKNLRTQLSNGMIFPNFAEEISSFLADSLLPTTDLVLDRHLKKKRVKQFVNIDLCDITEDLVLTEPYYNYKGRNVFSKTLKPFVEQNLYTNDELKANVGELRNSFMNNAQALLHGDLHTGSIFVNEQGIRVIDPEFAFYGPMGYDIGNVIGNLIFPYVVRLEKNTKNGVAADPFLAWMGSVIAEVFNLTFKKMEEKYEQLVEFPLYKTRKFENSYLQSVVSDSLGFAGTELIRRTVGDSKVPEITTIADSTTKDTVSKILVKTGMNLILNRKDYKTGNQIIQDVQATASKEIRGEIN